MLATKDLGHELGIKDRATGLLGHGRTASRPSPTFLPFISREPTGYIAPPDYTGQPTYAVSPSLVAPVTTDPFGHDGTINRPGLSPTSPHAGDNPKPGNGPDSQLDHDLELQEPPPIINIRPRIHYAPTTPPPTTRPKLHRPKSTPSTPLGIASDRAATN
jgi:hypothetical protein